MKAMVIHEFGGSKLFQKVEIEKPTVTPGHVVVKVAASSVNPIDYKIRSAGDSLPFAPPLPAVLGMDFAGVIEGVGDGVEEYSVGDEVYGCAGGLGDLPGSLAEYMLADVRLIARKPKNLSMAEAAALPLVSITAYEGLMRAGVKPEQSLLVHGGSGGVGHIATQLAVYFGANVCATGGGARQLDFIKQLGAQPINYKTESVADYVSKHTDGKGFELVFDSVGERNLVKSMEAAALNGQIATTVSRVELDLSPAHLKGLSLHVVFMLIPMIHNIGREAHGKILEEIAAIVEAGKLKPMLTEQQFSLEDVGSAHAYAEAGDGLGKVVINIT